jgi:hypothetical protein
MAILKSEVTVDAGDARSAKDKETLQVIPPSPSLSVLAVDAAATNTANEVPSSRYKAIINAIRLAKMKADEGLGEGGK